MTEIEHDTDCLVREDFENVRAMFPEHPMPPWEELTEAEKTIVRAAYAQKSGFFQQLGDSLSRPPPSHEDRMAKTRDALAKAGYSEQLNGYWVSKNYRATITRRLTDCGTEYVTTHELIPKGDV